MTQIGDLLTDEEKGKLRAKAVKKLVDEKKKEQEAKLLALYEAEERARTQPTHETVDITIDLPGTTSYMMIDGVKHPHGKTLTVPKHVADCIREQIERCWQHERQTGNPNMRSYIPIQDNTSIAKTQAGRFARG